MIGYQKGLLSFRHMKNRQKTFFGERLRSLRLQRGLTQTQLGERVGLSKRMIFHYEKHATRPPADKVVDLAGALGLHVNDLVNGNGHTVTADVDPKFARKLERAKQLPQQDQQMLSGIIDTFLQKNGLTRKRRKASNTNKG